MMMQSGRPAINIRCVQTASLVLIFLLLVSCGFHLRGAYQLQPQMTTTYVSAKNLNSELVRGLKRSLELSGVLVANDKIADAAELKIIHEKIDKRVLSVDENGRAREYEMAYRVKFSVLTQDLPDDEHEVELIRDFLFDPENLLGKGNEEAILMRSMQDDMVRMIMLRLQAMRPVAESPDKTSAQ